MQNRERKNEKNEQKKSDSILDKERRKYFKTYGPLFWIC